MSGFSHDALRTVVEDLEYLRDEWVADLDEPGLRRGSAVVRRLLVDGGNAQVLRHAWRAAGFQGEPSVRAIDLLDQVDGPLSTVDWASAGGVAVDAHPGRVGHTIVYNVGRSGPNGEPIATSSITYDPLPLFGVSDWLEQPCAVIRGELIRRREMIKYVANFLGGVHLDSGKKVHARDKDLVRRVEAWLDRLKIDGFGKSGPYFEVLAAGQALGKSQDCQSLIAAFRGGPDVNG